MNNDILGNFSDIRNEYDKFYNGQASQTEENVLENLPVINSFEKDEESQSQR